MGFEYLLNHERRYTKWRNATISDDSWAESELLFQKLKKWSGIRVLHTTKGWNADRQGDLGVKCCSTFDAVVPCSTFEKVGNSEIIRQLRYYKIGCSITCKSMLSDNRIMVCSTCSTYLFRQNQNSHALFLSIQSSFWRFHESGISYI